MVFFASLSRDFSRRYFAAREMDKGLRNEAGKDRAKVFQDKRVSGRLPCPLISPMRRNVYFSKYDFKAEAFFSPDENIELPIISRYNNKYLRFLRSSPRSFRNSTTITIASLSLPCNRRDQFRRG